MSSIVAVSPLARIWLVVRQQLDRTARGLPGAEAALDVCDRPQPHAMGGLRRERRAGACRAEEHKLLVLRERLLVILAQGVDPEFQHAARTMERARHPASRASSRMSRRS